MKKSSEQCLRLAKEIEPVFAPVIALATEINAGINTKYVPGTSSNLHLKTLKTFESVKFEFIYVVRDCVHCVTRGVYYVEGAFEGITTKEPSVRIFAR